MGPFPHDAPPPKVDATNPMGTDGFEFVEYAHPNPAELHALFKSMGFTPVGVYSRVGYKLGRWHDVMWLQLRLSEELAPRGEPALTEHLFRDPEVKSLMERCAGSVKA